MTQSVALDEVLDDFVPPYTHQVSATTVVAATVNQRKDFIVHC
jgi:hypothetical protein